MADKKYASFDNWIKEIDGPDGSDMYSKMARKWAKKAWLAAKEKYEPRWLPIETAPKQIEFRCLLANEFSVVTGYWDGEGWVNERSPVKSYFRATRWMQLPSTPGGGE